MKIRDLKQEEKRELGGKETLMKEEEAKQSNLPSIFVGGLPKVGVMVNNWILWCVNNWVEMPEVKIQDLKR